MGSSCRALSLPCPGHDDGRPDHAPVQRWDPSIQRYIDSLKDPERWEGSPYSARYIGSLVGDFHRTLLYGGWRTRGKRRCDKKLGCTLRVLPFYLVARQSHPDSL